METHTLLHKLIKSNGYRTYKNCDAELREMQAGWGSEHLKGGKRIQLLEGGGELNNGGSKG
jgi:hypothetical protein